MAHKPQPAVLTGIETGPPGSKWRRLVIDGEPWRATSADALKLLDIQLSDVVVPSELAESLARAESEACPARALRILQARDRSSGELRKRLADDGYPSELVSTVVARLEEVDLIDDRRLAEAIIVGLADVKGYGRLRIERQLKRRLIAGDIAEKVLSAFEPRETEDERARLLAQRLAGRSPDSRRLAERLVRKGFSWDVARRAASEALEGVDVDEA